MRFRALSAAVLGLALINTQAVTFIVTTTDDSGPGSLRQAILDANSAEGAGSIVFTTSGTIMLASALPIIATNVTIAGPGTNVLTISGNNAVQVLTVNTQVTATICDLTIANGRAAGYTNGAGIANAGNLTISNCAFVNNQTLGGWGGGVFNSGNLKVITSVFSGNEAVGEVGATSGGGGGAGLGGAIFTMFGSCNLTGCNFANNSATGGNGGSYPPHGGPGRGGGINGGEPGHGLQNNAGSGGFGGGGGGHNEFYSGGNGGFGGGGGGGGSGAQGGFGGGAGFGSWNCGGGGGGGAGIGGGIFIHSGTLSIVDCWLIGNQAVGGLGGPSPCGSGSAGSGVGPHLYNLTGTLLPILTATTPGGGTVPVNPPGPPYLTNSLATVTATPAPGWTLLHWLGDAFGTNSQVTLHMARNKTVQAIFGTQLSYTSPILASPQTPPYPYGTGVKFTAIPPAGTYFTYWTGDASGTNNPTFFTVTNPTLSISCQLGTLSSGETSLTVIENGKGQVALLPPKYRYYISETANLIPIPDPGQDFIGWSGDATGAQNPLLVSMAQSRVITANFTKRPSLRADTPLEGFVDGGFRLTLTGEFGTNYAILGSTNLADWTLVGTVANTYGTAQITDPAATNLFRRFYRALAQ